MRRRKVMDFWRQPLSLCLLCTAAFDSSCHGRDLAKGRFMVLITFSSLLLLLIMLLYFNFILLSYIFHMCIYYYLLIYVALLALSILSLSLSCSCLISSVYFDCLGCPFSNVLTFCWLDLHTDTPPLPPPLLPLPPTTLDLCIFLTCLKAVLFHSNLW